MGEYEKEVFTRAQREKSIEIAKQLIRLGKNTLEDIAEATGLPIATVQELAGERTA